MAMALASGLPGHGVGCALHRRGLRLVWCAPAGARATLGQAAAVKSLGGVSGVVDPLGLGRHDHLVKFFLFGPQELDTASIIASQPTP